jgi:hypothetical protein
MKNFKIVGIFGIEILLVVLFLFLFLFPDTVFAGVGTNNVTVITNLTVGKSYPIITQISIEQGSITLIPASTKKVNCTVQIEDYDGEADINHTTAVLFDPATSTYESGDDNNSHYTNTSCRIDTTYGNEYQALAHCLFDVWYNANAAIWNCTVIVNDSLNYITNGTNTTQIQPLLALGLPDIIQYGTVNATYVSDENITNVTNYGNVKVNISLSGYGFKENDGNAMNCTLGSIKNITIIYEKYNLTDSHPGTLSLGEFSANYTNLTSNPTTKKFDLDYRQQEDVNEAWNHTYWRIYVPLGVAGTCQGNIIFGAVQADGT